MGVFSFLTRRGRRTVAAEAAERTAAAEATAQPASMAQAAGSEADATPALPPAWNFGALSVPAPTVTSQGAIGPADPQVTEALKPRIVEALSTIFDPEIPVNIYELGLIYDIAADAQSRVKVTMTLTSPACPSAQQLPSEARFKVKAVPGVGDAFVDVVWDPPWTKDKMSDAAKLALGLW
jgi:FeS assembly SUF system protein